jgi:hypothetical protein
LADYKQPSLLATKHLLQLVVRDESLEKLAKEAFIEDISSEAPSLLIHLKKALQKPKEAKNDNTNKT